MKMRLGDTDVISVMGNGMSLAEGGVSYDVMRGLVVP